MLKRKLLTMMMIGVIGVTGVLGTSVSSHAANADNEEYSFNNSSAQGVGTFRNKKNSSTVFVHPTSGPKIFYTVQGKTAVGLDIVECSNIVAIPLNVKGSIVNHVRKDGCDKARLSYQRITTGYVYTKGMWSPDSLKDYTVFP